MTSYRILGLTLTADGLMSAIVARFDDVAGGPEGKDALPAPIPAERLTPIEHPTVDEPYGRLSLAERVERTAAFDAWIAQVSAFASVSRLAGGKTTLKRTVAKGVRPRSVTVRATRACLNHRA